MLLEERRRGCRPENARHWQAVTLDGQVEAHDGMSGIGSTPLNSPGGPGSQSFAVKWEGKAVDSSWYPGALRVGSGR